MREIKFRAWDAIEGKMWSPIIKPDGRLMAYNQIGSYVTFDDPQDPLMEFTGFKDNNKVEYYEDDLISNNLGTSKETIRQVKFIDGCWMLSRIKGNSNLPKNVVLSSVVGLNWPIIGSIHENPELLEG